MKNTKLTFVKMTDFASKYRASLNKQSNLKSVYFKYHKQKQRETRTDL